MPQKPKIDAARIDALAEFADLPLAAGRAEALASQLSEWLAAANELSSKMAAPEHLQVQPVAVFQHPDTKEGPDGQR